MLYDISKPLSQDSPVYPGDEPFSIRRTCSLENNDGAEVSAVCGSLHAGTHVDLPAHLGYGFEVPLSIFCGPATVIAAYDFTPGERVLIKSDVPPSFEIIRSLARSGCKLVGVETASVDELGSSTLQNHHALLSEGIPILENLDLSQVGTGDYQLFAFPLKIVGAEASWVRAVLEAL
jgi:arylformamidase